MGGRRPGAAAGYPAGYLGALGVLDDDLGERALARADLERARGVDGPRPVLRRYRDDGLRLRARRVRGGLALAASGSRTAPAARGDREQQRRTGQCGQTPDAPKAPPSTPDVPANRRPRYRSHVHVDSPSPSGFASDPRSVCHTRIRMVTAWSEPVRPAIVTVVSQLGGGRPTRTSTMNSRCFWPPDSLANRVPSFAVSPRRSATGRQSPAPGWKEAYSSSASRTVSLGCSSLRCSWAPRMRVTSSWSSTGSAPASGRVRCAGRE